MTAVIEIVAAIAIWVFGPAIRHFPGGVIVTVVGIVALLIWEAYGWL